MDDTLQRRIRLSYRKWDRACDHCARTVKAQALKDFRAACMEAIAYANTLDIPKVYGELRLSEVCFPFTLANWSKGRTGTGVVQGDTFDGGPVRWYWEYPHERTRQDSDVHWHSKPGDTLIDLIEHLERL